MKFLLFPLFIALISLPSFAQNQANEEQLHPPDWKGGETVTSSRDGFFALKWEVPEKIIKNDYQFEIQESKVADFSNTETIYQGTDLGTTLSGFPEGKYYYRVRTISPDGSKSEWSKVMEVQVDHHGLGKAFGFLGVGVVVFLLTAGLIIGGTRKQSTAKI